MSKKVGQKVNVRSGASYNYDSNTMDESNSRKTSEATITKVFSHGVKTKEIGYVNNNRILN